MGEGRQVERRGSQTVQYRERKRSRKAQGAGQGGDREGGGEKEGRKGGGCKEGRGGGGSQKCHPVTGSAR
jgi:hypothetical protein